MLTFTGKCLASESVEREWGKKDKDGNTIPGTLAKHSVFEGVLQLDDGTVLKVSSVDPTFALPSIGKAWTTPKVLTYNSYSVIPEIRV